MKNKMNNHSQLPKDLCVRGKKARRFSSERLWEFTNPFVELSVDSQNCRGNTLEVENRGCSIRNTRSGFYTDFCGTETHNKTKGKCRIAVGGSK